MYLLEVALRLRCAICLLLQFQDEAAVRFPMISNVRLARRTVLSACRRMACVGCWSFRATASIATRQPSLGITSLEPDGRDSLARGAARDRLERDDSRIGDTKIGRMRHAASRPHGSSPKHVPAGTAGYDGAGRSRERQNSSSGRTSRTVTSPSRSRETRSFLDTGSSASRSMK